MDWYPWYFTLYEQDTMHLTPYQDGCYRRLIDHYMKTRVSLPDNDAALARIIGDSEANWVAMASAIVRPFFRPQKGRLFLKRCEDILDYQDKKSKKLSESGKKGAQKRWNENSELDSPPIATPMATLKPTDSTGQYNTGKEVEKKSKPKKENQILVIPDWLQISEWSEYQEMRIKIKKPMTDAAKKMAIQELEKLRLQGQSPAEVLKQSIFNSWQGLFAVRNNQNGSAKLSPTMQSLKDIHENGW